MTQNLPSFLEEHISQIPALQLLQNLGWQYLTPAETVRLRSGKLSNVILEEVLAEQLRKLNRIQFKWFDIITANLTKEQKADQKKKFTTTDQLNKAEQKVKEIALDISMHFRDNWQGTPYKAQLVTQDKSSALLYKKDLDEFGMVSAEVLISGPDTREGNEEVEEESLPAVQQFWKKMMAKHGSEEQYNKNIINSFKSGDAPEIIIVVDKLLTGFDAPRNTVL